MKRSFAFRGMTVYANDLCHAKDYLKETYPHINQETLDTGKETDYDKVFTYFPIKEILPEDVPFIYDYKRKDTENEVASLSLRRASKYKSYLDRFKGMKCPSIHFWYQ